MNSRGVSCGCILSFRLPLDDDKGDRAQRAEDGQDDQLHVQVRLGGVEERTGAGHRLGELEECEGWCILAVLVERAHDRHDLRVVARIADAQHEAAEEGDGQAECKLFNQVG